MEQLANRQILLCVTGGIAAYKAAELIRLFKSSGSEVRVLMTEAAKEFITPLTMQALSGNEVHSDLLDTNAESAMGHIDGLMLLSFLLVRQIALQNLLLEEAMI